MYSITDGVTVKYLSIFDGSSGFFDSEGYLKAPLEGPNVIRFVSNKSSIRSYIKKLISEKTTESQSSSKPISFKLKKVTTDSDLSVNSLLFSMINQKKKTQKSPTFRAMDNKGALLVIIEGTESTLQAYKDMAHHYQNRHGTAIKKKPFLIPFASDAVEGCKDFKWNQRFHLKLDPNPLSESHAYSEHLDDFDNYCASDEPFPGPISTTCYDISKHDNGLIFAFRPNAQILHPTIVEEIILEQVTQPSEIYAEHGAYVLSEWFRNNSFLRTDQNAVNLVQRVHKQTGFGSRSCASSAGTNVYDGQKQTEATVGTPLVSKEDLFQSMLHTTNVDDTFMPALQKVLNKYSHEASDVMMSANRLLDKFYYMVFRSFDTQRKTSETLGNNRFCRLSIWTSGNLKERVDGFTNNIHVDRDYFQKAFQDAADWMISRLEEEDLFKKSDIEYLKNIKKMGGGKLQTPTVCGYDIIANDDLNEDMTNDDEWCTFAFFALLGLGVSVRISHSYHSFMAGIVSHCTPTPISVIHDTVSTYTGTRNVVGWGGGGNEKRREFYLEHGGQPVDRLTQAMFLNWLATVHNNIRILAQHEGLA